MPAHSDDAAAPPTKRCKLILQDGTELEGLSFGAEVPVAGEVVFSTGMVGYTEALTDPSFRGQLLCLTFPMIGNYGVPDRTLVDEHGLPRGFESTRIHAAALIVQDYSYHYSHWDAVSSLGDWLKEQGVPGICGLDTRLITKKIRDQGVMLGRLEVEGRGSELGFSDPNKKNLVAEVSTPEVRVFGKENGIKVLCVDCGIKLNIVRKLVNKGAEVTMVPHDYDLVSALPNFDGLFLSNGPGDPTMASATIAALRQVLSDVEAGKAPVKPIFGICLGNQLVSLAAGAKAVKLPFGNRGQNQPVRNVVTGDCYITPQNHGYAIEDSTLPAGWKTLFTNINDGTNEGVYHESRPYFTAQFHPEADSGPTDTEFLFDVFLDHCRSKATGAIAFPKPRIPRTPRDHPIKKCLLLGSGGLSIGQAGEFDYSGSQAIKALKEEGVEVILMNPNIASVQTNVDTKSLHKADEVFFLPVNPHYVEQVLKREKPDGIVISMGGQTALNCAVELYKAGTFEKYNVKVLGTPVEAIMATEDRDVFKDKLAEIDEKVAPSEACCDVPAALAAAKRIGYPVMVRAAYALGGLGSGICENEEQTQALCQRALVLSPQVLVEKSLWGWKEVEYEVVRDRNDNCITVCNMENFDPLGVHTGDSIVVAPSQTLSNAEYHMLRETAIKVVRHLGIVGECNIQYALDPCSTNYCIIEVNARLSRSSALASKATGYPLAFVAAKLALGITLPEIENAITRRTMACFEPSLDYCVTKVPRWDLSKFENVSTEIGSAMLSVGEVMSIGRTWEESVQKALRMVDPTAVQGFQPRKARTRAQMERELGRPTDLRMFAIAQALYEGSMTVDEVHNFSKIDRWFLRRLERIAKHSREVLSGSSLEAMTAESMLLSKRLGFSDNQIAARVVGECDDLAVRRVRKALGVRPHVKQIDTLAAEYPAATNYLYMTYHGAESDTVSDGGGMMVLGSGTYRIGSSVEFDWCGVSSVRALRQMGYRATMVNYNPETVSTDYDECDQLYFEELSRERVMDICEQEAIEGIIVSVGGQIPQNLALPLKQAGMPILGTAPENIDNAEDRHKFSALVDAVGLEQAPWEELSSSAAALEFAQKVGFPVLIRPSYVLSGAAMNVAYDAVQLTKCLTEAAEVSNEFPVVVSKYISGAREVEMDAVAQDGEVVAAATHIHVENAGVHSGDATLLLPAGPEDLSSYSFHRVQEATAALAKALQVTGPFNIQFLVKGVRCMVIECNLRASRSFPFVSKTMGVDFIEAATRVMVHKDISGLPLPKLFETGRPKGYVACKVPMFSFTRLKGADPILGVEMASTGEVACFGATKQEAFLKALLSTGFKMPEKGILFSAQEQLLELLTPAAFELGRLGFSLYATEATHKYFQAAGVESTLLHFPSSKESPTVLQYLRDRNVDLVVNLPTSDSVRLEDNYTIRRTAVDLNIPLLTNLNLVQLFAEAMGQFKKQELVGLLPESLFDYYEREKPEEAWTNPKEFH